MGADPGETAALLDAVRPATAKPLIVKLTPELRVARPTSRPPPRHHGADAVSLINTLRGMAMHPAGRASRGWAAAPAACPGRRVRAVALAQVARGARARRDPDRRHGRGTVRPSCRKTCCEAGADLVGVGTEIIRDPLAGGQGHEKSSGALPAWTELCRAG